MTELAYPPCRRQQHYQYYVNHRISFPSYEGQVYKERQQQNSGYPRQQHRLPPSGSNAFSSCSRMLGVRYLAGFPLTVSQPSTLSPLSTLALSLSPLPQ
jgi:hypothetical protein